MRDRPRFRRQSIVRNRGPLVLVVDDDLAQLELCTVYFVSQGLRVETASDGESAFRRAVESVPDVIVMDLSMPRVSGWDATARIKQEPRTAHIPIVACTGHAFGLPVERALEAGCDAYVVKPCPPDQLVREIRSALARSQRARPA